MIANQGTFQAPNSVRHRASVRAVSHGVGRDALYWPQYMSRLGVVRWLRMPR